MTVISATDVRNAGRATLEQFLPLHLAGLSRPLPAPTTYDMVVSQDNVRRVQGVVCAVSSNGPVEPPTRKGDGSYDGWFNLLVALFHQQTPAMPLIEATSDFAAAISECLIQHPTLGGLTSSVQLEGSDTDLVRDELHASKVNLGLALVEFRVQVKGFLDMTPPNQPVLGTVQSTSTAVSRL